MSGQAIAPTLSFSQRAPCVRDIIPTVSNRTVNDLTNDRAVNIAVNAPDSAATIHSLTDVPANPAPGDWLMTRRDFYASSYSPLTQITRENAGELQLAWVSPMVEGGTNQPVPLAHDGTVFLNNPNGGVVQAIDGKSGDLIW